MVWYSKPIDEIILELNTDAKNGLSRDIVNRRRARYGASAEIRPSSYPEFKPWLLDILPIFIICAAAALFYGLTRCYVHCAVVLITAAVTALLRLYIYYRACCSLHTADIASRTAVTVIRGGLKAMVEQSELVPGDIVTLKPGDIITADIRLIESNSLFINESHLEGGFINSPKAASDDTDEMNEESLTAHTNMCYRGSSVMSGSGKGVVVAIGAACAVIPSPLAESVKPSELNSRLLSRQHKRFATAVRILCAAIFIIGLLFRQFSTDNLAYMFYTCAGLLTAVIPLGFTICEILLLSVGMDKLSARGIHIKSFRALREISRTGILVVQKTGVVTSNDMTVTQLWAGGELIDVRGHGWSPEGRFFNSTGEEVHISRNRSAALTLIGGALCGNSDIEEIRRGKWTYRGDPTESSLAALAAKAGLFRADVNEMFPRIAEYPFDSVRRLMATVHKRGRQTVVYVKGAPDAVLTRCTRVDVNGVTHELSDEAYEQVAGICQRMAEKGLRTIAIAYREMDFYEPGTDVDAIEDDLILCGIAGIENRVAPSSVSAYNLCSSAGMRTFIVTGDDVYTSTETALSMGIHEPVLDARSFEEMSDDQLAEALSQARVAARVDASSKQRIVNILRRTGSFVTFAGSDPSDAEALRAADIGIASGASSSELSREAAQIVMDDGSFNAIVRVIEESRRIFSSLKAYIGYAMTCAFTLLITMLIYAFSSGAMPFTPLQLFWMSAILLTVPVFTIGRDANVHRVMHARPRSEGDAVVNLHTTVVSFVQSLVPAGLIMAAIALAEKRTDDGGVICCTAFVTAALIFVLLAHPNRSCKESLARIGFLTNIPLFCVTGGVIAFLAAVTCIPPLRLYFDAVNISFRGWLIALLFALASFVWGELFKVLIRPLIGKFIKDTPINTGHRKFIDLSISSRFFAKFEGADPTQEEDEYVSFFRRRRRHRDFESEAADEPVVEQLTLKDTVPLYDIIPLEKFDENPEEAAETEPADNPAEPEAAEAGEVPEETETVEETEPADNPAEPEAAEAGELPEEIKASDANEASDTETDKTSEETEINA